MNDVNTLVQLISKMEQKRDNPLVRRLLGEMHRDYIKSHIYTPNEYKEFIDRYEEVYNKILKQSKCAHKT